MADIERDDVINLYDKVKRQFEEDRTLVKDVFDELREYVTAEPARYMECGDTLGKYADLMIKQTSQVLDFAKLISKEVESTGDLSLEDYDFIDNQITDLGSETAEGESEETEEVESGD